MNWDDNLFFDGVDEATIRSEKTKARELRKSRWWLNKLSEGRCFYCRRQIAPRELTMDHVLPLARGGRSTKSNLVTCCKTCNNAKKSMMPLEWEDYLAGLADRDSGEEA